MVPSDNPPFAVMGWLAEASREDQARLWRSSLEVLVQLHALELRRQFASGRATPLASSDSDATAGATIHDAAIAPPASRRWGAAPS